MTTGINFNRLLLSGLITGVVLNIGEFLLNEIVFVKEMEAVAHRLNVLRPDIKFNLTASALTLIMGVVIMLIFVLIRSRLGPGPKAILVAALVPWFCLYIYAAILNTLLLDIPLRLLGIGMVWGLFEYCIAAFAGAWFYKEG